jgi:hypothetical protein
MLVKKVTERQLDSSKMFNEPVEVTIYYFLGIPFRKDIIKNILDRSLK